MKKFCLWELLRAALYTVLTFVFYLGLLPGNGVLFVISYFFMVACAFYALLLFFNILRVLLIYLIKRPYALLSLFYYFINQKNYREAWKLTCCNDNVAMPKLDFINLESSGSCQLNQLDDFKKHWSRLTEADDFNYLDLVSVQPGVAGQTEAIIRILKGGYRRVFKSWLLNQFWNALSTFYPKKKKAWFLKKNCVFTKDKSGKVFFSNPDLSYELASQNYRELSD